MARNRDLFDDTTMTFGEHLEVLRVHVWKSLIGIAIGVVLAMLVGDRIIGILKAPIEQALHDANLSDVQDDLKEVSILDYFTQMWSEEDEPETAPPEEVPAEEQRPDIIQVQIPATEVARALQQAAPELVAAPQDQGASSDASDQDPPQVTLTLQAPEFAQLRKTVDRMNKPTTFQVEEGFLTYLKVTIVAGIMLASPWVFYQIWEFVGAGLYPHERKYVHRFLPMSLGLFGAGAIFCFYLVFPLVLSFLIGFSQWLGVELQPRLSEYIRLVLMLPLMFGISFQLPLVMLFLERIGVVTIATYTENWRMSVLVMSIVSMLLTPSDPGSMLLMLAPLIVLYFGGIQLCRMGNRPAPDPLA